MTTFPTEKRLDNGNYVFINAEGQASEEFYLAKPYTEGFAIVKKTKTSPDQYRDINGNLSEGFQYAHPYSDTGLAIVQKEIDGPYQYRDTDGNLSEEFWSADPYSSAGLALVKKSFRGPYRFRDTQGNLRGEFYYADSYSSEGLAIVQKEENGPFQFRDAKGTLSEKFYYARRYTRGLAIVQKEKDGPFQLRDTKGNLSEEFYHIYGFEFGFAKVKKTKTSPDQYRDQKGQLINELPQNVLGQTIYLSGDKTPTNSLLADSDFTDSRFVQYMKQRELARYQQAIDHAQSEEEIADITAQFQNIINYIDDRTEWALSDEYNADPLRESRKKAYDDMLKYLNTTPTPDTNPTASSDEPTK